jgi:Cu+-exporting ATPase
MMLQPNSNAGATTELDISGMTCAACSARISKVLSRVDGVTEARVNLPLERAEIIHDGSVTTETLIERVRKAGYDAHERRSGRTARKAADEARAARQRAEARQTGLRFVISAALSIPLVVGTAPMMLGIGHALIGPWTQAVLAGGVMAASGTKFWREAWAAVRGGSANMAVLVSLGTTTAYLFSLVQTLRGEGHGHLYFEAAAVVLTLVMLGKLLESRAKAGASKALEALEKLQPDSAERVGADGRTETVPLEQLARGDRVMIRPGSRVPVDGTIIEGRSSFDEQLVTGESDPVVREAGARVLTGTVNGESPVTIRVEALGEQTRLAGIARLVEEAQLSEAPVQRLVDRISAVFVPVIIAIAMVTFGGWWLYSGQFETAIINAVSVLVIACPCALGLATPTALVAGTGAAAKAGILIRDIETLETAAGIRHVAFDKTGTLTAGRPQLSRIVVGPGGSENDALALAGALEQSASHPLADAVARAVEHRGVDLSKAVDVKTVGGRGMEGVVVGQSVALGNAAHMAMLGIGEHGLIDGSSGTASYLAVDGRLIARLEFADVIRSEAKEAVAALVASDVTPWMLTGDNARSAQTVAAQVGIAQFEAAMLPEAKLERIRAIGGGQKIAFVGDGMNDAPALAAADLGIALAGGTDVAREAAGVTLMRPDLRLVPASLDIAARTRRTIRQNLVWAFIYNVVGIPLAAFGILSPVMAGAAMAFSSVSVVTNSALLARWRPWFNRSA